MTSGPHPSDHRPPSARDDADARAEARGSASPVLAPLSGGSESYSSAVEQALEGWDGRLGVGSRSVSPHMDQRRSVSPPIDQRRSVSPPPSRSVSPPPLPAGQWSAPHELAGPTAQPSGPEFENEPEPSGAVTPRHGITLATPTSTPSPSRSSIPRPLRLAAAAPALACDPQAAQAHPHFRPRYLCPSALSLFLFSPPCFGTRSVGLPQPVTMHPHGPHMHPPLYSACCFLVLVVASVITLPVVLPCVCLSRSTQGRLATIGRRCLQRPWVSGRR